MSVKVIIPKLIKPPPSKKEVLAARIISKHFNHTVEFLIPIDNYKRKTPDIAMAGLLWEIKSPVGSSVKTTINDQVKTALKQSVNIIIDTQYTPIPDVAILKQLANIIKLHKRLNKLLIISKGGKVIVVYSRK